MEKFASDESIRNRITLLEGYQAHARIRDLGFRRIVKFATVFISAPGSAAQSVGTQSKPSLKGHQVGKGPFTITAVDPGKLGPMLKNKEGKRVDKPLAVDPSLVQAIKKKNLCGWLFLKGHCSGCDRNHTHAPLSNVEQEALWVVARQGSCHTHRKGKFCDEPLCIYGHATWSGPNTEVVI